MGVVRNMIGVENMKKRSIISFCILVFVITVAFAGCGRRSGAGTPLETGENAGATTLPAAPSEETSDPPEESQTEPSAEDNIYPGYVPIDALISHTVMWTSLDPDGGLSEYQELELPWLNDPYIEQYKKSLRAIQFGNEDILIVMKTASIEDMQAYTQYINEHVDALAQQLGAEVYTDLSSIRTEIIISRDKLSVILGSYNKAKVGYLPEYQKNTEA